MYRGPISHDMAYSMTKGYEASVISRLGENDREISRVHCIRVTSSITSAASNNPGKIISYASIQSGISSPLFTSKPLSFIN